MTQPSEPRTKEGRALLASLASGEYRLTPEQEADYTNAILAIEAQAQVLRPRWHHDKTLRPDDRQYCEDCAELERHAQAAERYGGLIATMDNAVRQGLAVHVATRATCAEHLEHGDDRATEPLTAAAFGLNVERLARALHLTDAIFDNHVEFDQSICQCREQAKAIAAEYARLEGQPVAEDSEL